MVRTGIRSFLFVLLFACIWFTDAVARDAVAVKEGILLAAFGTSVPEARQTFTEIEKSFKTQYPDAQIAWTYTSSIIRKKLAGQGVRIPGIAESLQSFSKKGVRVLRIQPLHVMGGEEYSEFERALLLAVSKHAKRFSKVYFGRPLLESREDAYIVCEALLKRLAPKRGEGEALVLMGHGNEKGRAGLTFEGLRQVFSELDSLTILGSVEGERGFPDILKELRAKNVKKVLLAPFMLVAGDHARNDLAGEEADSWLSKLKAEGYTVSVSLEGLGALPEVSALYIRHARESSDDLTKEPKKQ
ncbi:MAG: sirohydrochlorin cobaltochelatase [Desulfovibrionaceae bacterium]|nr:sirohydrochlorin cobaltochelatase [Desulfovibrionaceae bacterium]